MQSQLKEGMLRAKNHYKADKFIVYFQPNSNTHAPVSILKPMYDESLSINTEDVVGFSVGTRPDCIDAEKVTLLESYCDRFDVDLEMGMESIYDATLEQINRGCSHAEFVAAVELLKDSPVDLSVFTIFGFPWETRDIWRKKSNAGKLCKVHFMSPNILMYNCTLKLTQCRTQRHYQNNSH